MERLGRGKKWLGAILIRGIEIRGEAGSRVSLSNQSLNSIKENKVSLLLLVQLETPYFLIWIF